MTPNQSRVRQAFVDLHRGNVPPTIREVCSHTGMRIQAVHDAIQDLIDDGLIVEERQGARARKYRAVGTFDNAVLNRMCHADLLALRDKVDTLLSGRKLAA